MVTRRVDQAVVDVFKNEGVKYVFGLPGGHSCEIMYDALYDTPEITAILSRHEESGAFEAYGYAQITNRVGICHGTAGPGFGQIIPGLHDAWASRTPIIAICASSPAKYYQMGALQEFPQIETAAPFCKWVYRVDMASKIQWVLKRAFNIALTPPCGPVYIDIPIDLGQQTFEASSYRPQPPVKQAGDPEYVNEACEILLKAERPIIVAGRGVHASGAWNELRELAEFLAIPVLTTNSGKGSIPEDHPLSAGGVGINRTRFSEKIYESADVMLWIGSQLEEWSTGVWQWKPSDIKFIYIDADPSQMSRNWAPDLSVAGDAKLVLKQFLDYLKAKAERRGEDYPRIRELEEARREYLAEVEALRSIGSKPIHPGRLVVEVSDAMDDAIVVLGEGANRIWTATYLQVRAAGHWISASDYGCMGLSVPASIGVKLGRPDKQVICITGDGSFQMQMHELPVAKQYNAPVTWIIPDDGCLGWIKWYQKEFKNDHIYCVDYDPPWRFDKVAEAGGIQGFSVQEPSELSETVQKALKLNREGESSVVDVLTQTAPHPYGSDKYHRIGMPDLT